MTHKKINKEEHEYLTEFFKVQHNELSIVEQQRLLGIYQRTVDRSYKVSSGCGGCWRNLINSLTIMHKQY